MFLDLLFYIAGLIMVIYGQYSQVHDYDLITKIINENVNNKKSYTSELTVYKRPALWFDYRVAGLVIEVAVGGGIGIVNAAITAALILEFWGFWATVGIVVFGMFYMMLTIWANESGKCRVKRDVLLESYGYEDGDCTDHEGFDQ